MGSAKGILGTKLGMTQIYTEDSRVVPVTVIQAGPCLVTQVKTKERDGYEAVQLAFAEARKGKANRPATGHFQAAGVKPTTAPDGVVHVIRNVERSATYMSFAPWESLEAQQAWKELPEFRERIGRVRAHCDDFEPSVFELVTRVD